LIFGKKKLIKVSTVEYLVGFNPNKKIDHRGGSYVIKRLIEILILQGQKVYVLNSQYNIDGSILIEIDDLPKLKKRKIVVIYPEIIEGNPYNFSNVCRWIMYNTKEKVEKTWSTTDEYFYFNNFFKTKRQVDEKKLLTCFYTNLDKLYDLGKKRSGYAHIDKYPRSIMDPLTVKKYNSEEIYEGFRLNGFDWLREKLNQKKYFITNDRATYFSVMAALCGCESIILCENLVSEQDKENLLTHKYAISYNFEESKEKKKEVHLLRNHLKKIEDDSFKSVTKFINFWDKKYRSNKLNLILDWLNL